MDDNEKEDQIMIPVRHKYRNKTFVCITIAFLSFFVIICVHFEDIENYFGFNTCVNEIIIKDQIEIPDNGNNLETESETEYREEEKIHQSFLQNETEFFEKEIKNKTDLETNENQITLSIISDNNTSNHTLIQTLIIDKSEKIESLLDELSAKQIKLEDDLSLITAKQVKVENDIIKIAEKQTLMENDIFDILDNQARIEQVLNEILTNQKKIQIDLLRTIEAGNYNQPEVKVKSRKRADKSS